MASRGWSVIAAVLGGALVTSAASAASAARGPDAASPVIEAPSEPGYRLPSAGVVLRLFERPELRWSAGHRGVDVAVEDGVVRAPGSGEVTFAGRVVDRGVVTIAHPDGLRSSLEPVVDPPPVGTAVAVGWPVGTLEPTGHCGGEDCVHWGVRRGEDYLDPLSLLGIEPVVLLPVP